jgi:hypothetical protein
MIYVIWSFRLKGYKPLIIEGTFGFNSKEELEEYWKKIGGPHRYRKIIFTGIVHKPTYLLWLLH